MSSTAQLYASLGYIIFFIVLSYFFKKYPPKKINWTYGYRTRRSMANQQVWDAANTYWTAIFYKWQWYTLLLPAIVFIIEPKYSFLATVIGHSMVVILTMPATELYLDKHFDKNGHPK